MIIFLEYNYNEWNNKKPKNNFNETTKYIKKKNSI